MVNWANVVRAVSTGVTTIGRAAPTVFRGVTSAIKATPVYAAAGRAATVVSEVTGAGAIAQAATQAIGGVSRWYGGLSPSARTVIKYGAPAVAVGAVRAVTDIGVQRAITQAPSPTIAAAMAKAGYSGYVTDAYGRVVPVYPQRPTPTAEKPGIIQQAKETWEDMSPLEKGAVVAGTIGAGALVAGALVPEGEKEVMGFDWSKYFGGGGKEAAVPTTRPKGHNIVVMPDGSVKKLVSANAKIARRHKYRRGGGMSAAKVQQLINQSQSQTNMMMMMMLAGRHGG